MKISILKYQSNNRKCKNMFIKKKKNDNFPELIWNIHFILLKSMLSFNKSKDFLILYISTLQIFNIN